ncbi:MAG TPA: LysR family transcriptional regulator [Rubrivivax sp.]|nr:LysR family transcriptional regulator [Rubrivivax sp.]HPO17638.1 LysR family transcriptional regulator [Rubrivivax sp.]
MSLRLEDLDYFLAVARHGQVRRAAAGASVTQPAITKGIQRLEAELGFPLFERSRRGMALTAPAQAFLQRIGSLRANLGDAIKEAADLHLGALGVLRVGVSPLYAQRLFVPACLRLQRERPAARVVVDVNLNAALIAALQRGDIDLSLNALPPALPEALQAAPLMRDDLCMVVRSGHPLLSRRRLRLADLAGAPWMLPGAQVGARRSVEARLAEAGLPPPRVVVEVGNTTAQLTGLLLGSDLIAVVSESMLGASARRALVPLPMAAARFERHIGVLTRRDARLPPLAERFAQIVAELQR